MTDLPRRPKATDLPPAGVDNPPHVDLEAVAEGLRNLPDRPTDVETAAGSQRYPVPEELSGRGSMRESRCRTSGEAARVTEALRAKLHHLEVTGLDVAVSQNIVFIPALSVPGATNLLEALGGYPPLRPVEGGRDA